MENGKAGRAGGSDPRSDVRRRDRAKEDDWVRAFLGRATHGFLATVDERGQPFLNSNLFVYDPREHCIYVHTHRTGRTRTNVEAHDKVAFGVATMGRLLPAPTALDFSVEYSGATVFGRGRVVSDPEESRAALQKLLDKYAPHLEPGRDYRPTTDAELERTSVYRIDIETWSGKQKSVAHDFPGAFEVPAPTVPFVVEGAEAP
jgi:nitroimidazol reductase NimA-like FMN-containing flavoprotein (pyridoxamine 5'-phosphate oxidase superfamily)